MKIIEEGLGEDSFQLTIGDTSNSLKLIDISTELFGNSINHPHKSSLEVD